MPSISNTNTLPVSPNYFDRSGGSKDNRQIGEITIRPATGTGPYFFDRSGGPGDRRQVVEITVRPSEKKSEV